MKILVVEPMKPCEVREISGLDDMQAIVGGHIQAVYPFQEEVAVDRKSTRLNSSHA